MHARAEVAQDADAPVTHVVEVALDDDRAVVRHRTRGRLLIAEVLQKIARRTFGEGVLGHKLRLRVVWWQRAHPSRERADRASEFERAAHVLPMPERHPPGDARGR